LSPRSDTNKAPKRLLRIEFGRRTSPKSSGQEKHRQVRGRSGACGVPVACSSHARYGVWSGKKEGTLHAFKKTGGTRFCPVIRHALLHDASYWGNAEVKATQVNLVADPKTWNSVVPNPIPPQATRNGALAVLSCRGDFSEKNIILSKRCVPLEHSNGPVDLPLAHGQTNHQPPPFGTNEQVKLATDYEAERDDLAYIA
jgi:hypothetical protein